MTIEQNRAIVTMIFEQAWSQANFNGINAVIAENLNLDSIIRRPLGMGLLTGKFAPGTSFVQDDVRTHADWHPGFDSAPRWKKTPAPCSTAPLTPDQMAKIDRILERG